MNRPSNKVFKTTLKSEWKAEQFTDLLEHKLKYVMGEQTPTVAYRSLPVEQTFDTPFSISLKNHYTGSVRWIKSKQDTRYYIFQINFATQEIAVANMSDEDKRLTAAVAAEVTDKIIALIESVI